MVWAPRCHNNVIQYHNAQYQRQGNRRHQTLPPVGAEPLRVASRLLCVACSWRHPQNRKYNVLQRHQKNSMHKIWREVWTRGSSDMHFSFFSGCVSHDGVLSCRRYVARSCGHWPFSRLSGSRCWLTVHQYQSPSASWYEGVHKVSSNDWAVGATPQWPDADPV